MIKNDDKTKCCGCKTCSIVCPEQCITFTADSIGALYPTVDKECCINCGRCEAVCPIQQDFDGSIGLSAYAAFSKNRGIRFRGSSGGMFETIASAFIDKSGIVFASKFDDDMKLKCVAATTDKEVKQLTKSKYLQSDCSSVFLAVKEAVKEGRQVLFCGTPCQASALKRYLGKLSEQNNILLVDFFCHGVPSQSFFDRCIKYIEKRDDIRITAYEFRTKKPNGATPHYYSLEYIRKGKKKKKTELYLKDPFYLGFQKYITLRDSCYHCPYGEGNHAGDITIGDFHNIDKYIKGINRFDGVSTVIVNTEKGKQIWNQIEDRLTVFEMNLQALFEDKQVYAGGTEEPESRTEFIHDMEKLSFDEIAKKWLNSKAEWKKEIYYALPAPIRKKIKGLIGI